MSQKNKVSFVIEELAKLFPDAKCELNYRNVYELSVAVILSAQTTDRAVNLVTPKLFEKYPDLFSLRDADLNDLSSIISSIGMYKKKSEYLKGFAEAVIDRFNGEIPKTIEELTTIPGIGSKTANVIISEGYHLPGLAVDVHVARCANRLGLVNEQNPLIIEKELKQMIPMELWHIMHHRFIFMGRYLCKSQKPECERCPFTKICKRTN